MGYKNSSITPSGGAIHHTILSMQVRQHRDPDILVSVCFLLSNLAFSSQISDAWQHDGRTFQRQETAQIHFPCQFTVHYFWKGPNFSRVKTSGYNDDRKSATWWLVGIWCLACSFLVMKLRGRFVRDIYQVKILLKLPFPPKTNFCKNPNETTGVNMNHVNRLIFSAWFFFI